MSVRDFSGKTILVTGSSRLDGIGFAIIKKFAGYGANVIIHDRDELEAIQHEETRTNLQSFIAELNGRAVYIPADLSDAAQIETFVQKAIQAFGQLDILVNNAGIGFLVGSVIDQPVEDWDAVMAVNVRAPWLLMKHVGAHMLEKGIKGRIVSIGSQASKSGISLMSAYSTSKHALVGLTRSAALEYAPHGITVNMICPNHVPTALGNWQRENMSKMRNVSQEDYWVRFKQKVPLGFPGTPEDTANVCAFLCSEEGRYITAEAVNVSGGEEYH